MRLGAIGFSVYGLGFRYCLEPRGAEMKSSFGFHLWWNWRSRSDRGLSRNVEANLVGNIIP